MPPGVFASKEEMMQDFIDAFDEFVARLAEHGQAGKALQAQTVLSGQAGGRVPQKYVDAMAEAEKRFAVARDRLVDARNKMGPMGVGPGNAEGIEKRIWTPGRT